MGYDQKITTELIRCKGCNQIHWCDIYHLESNYVFTCPCRFCLFKMICMEACGGYNKNAATIYRDDNFIMDMKKNEREMRVAYNGNILRLRNRDHE